MNCAPFALTSVTSSWKPFCLRSIGRTSFSKRLLSSVSLPLLIWKWTLRANCMMLLPEPLSRWSSSESPKRRAGVDKVPKPAWTFEGIQNYHRSRWDRGTRHTLFRFLSKDYDTLALFALSMDNNGAFIGRLWSVGTS